MSVRVRGKRPHARKRSETPPWMSKRVGRGGDQSRHHGSLELHFACHSKKQVLSRFLGFRSRCGVFNHATRAAFRGSSIRYLGPPEFRDSGRFPAESLP